MRDRDASNVIKVLLAVSLFAKLPYLPNFLASPRWLTSFLLDGFVRNLENIVIPGHGPMELMDVVAALSRAVVTWEDLGWIREIWRGPIVVKGILTGDDAKRAADKGAAAIGGSTHGGRQLDGVPSSSRARRAV